jgi:DNA-binding response OmpR family regulator
MEKIKILYVDDETDVLQMMKIGLEDRGYDVRISDNGNGALELLKTDEPDIIIADLRMSPMNGFELFQEVKKIKQLKDVPFFFLTAVDDFLAQKYGHSLGVDAYITKPVDMENLDLLIKQKTETK